MLDLSLVLSVVLVGLAVAAARRPPEPVLWGVFLLCGLGVSFAPICIGAALPTVWLLFVLLAVSLLVWQFARHRVRRYYPFAAAAFVVAYLNGMWTALAHLERYEQVRRKYPFESMADRVPEPRTHDAPDPEAAAWLAEVDEKVGDDRRAWRADMLRHLHEDTTWHFVNSPGFGVTRGFLPPGYVPDFPREPTPKQPGTSDGYRDIVAATERPTAEREELRAWHAGTVLDFVNPAGFGYLRDRQHVAGFLPHAMTKVPDPVRRWQVESIELVGLLLRPDPVVYVSEYLPAMEQVATAKTRPLDRFETAGLESVRGGRDLSAAEEGSRLRVFGAIRSGKRCVACHGGEYGDLLGAFTYALRAGGP